MSKREINLKVLKSDVNAVLDHLQEDLEIENVTIENERTLIGIALTQRCTTFQCSLATSLLVN